MDYELMKKVSELNRTLEFLSNSWASDVTEEHDSVEALITRLAAWLPQEQLGFYVELPDLMTKKADGKPGVWRVRFEVQSAEKLRLVKLGIQPDREAKYLHISLELLRNVPIDFINTRWVEVDVIEVLAGPLQI